MFGKKKQADTPETEPVAAPLQKTREEREEEERKAAELSAGLMKLPSCCQLVVKRNSVRWRLLNPASRR